ncbi:glucosamine-6-phosphate deaminase [Scopulibacillus darangshiensis]|uniref:Glucosamine-6-phosphate deaminase n=1 Tax=Scopulibacillus darangshiensis TaxID=442528 RepID=A0A4R2P654_9BACL|nr:glucosamine-6-phosphate deaminase [Scopulibacillus darangshiensis]TCP30197.1 glucosamine-6-phosphate deaminase [Scopulibacillus darangshiensis]
MKIIEAQDYGDLSLKAAQYVIAKVKEKSNIVLGLATGSTPEGTYKEIIRDFNDHHTSYRYVRSVNLDEYVGLSKDHPNSYHTYMFENLFRHLDLPEDQRFLPDGNAEDLEDECRRYDRLIQSLGGVDLQLLGIGQNGHIGFNEPGTTFDQRTHTVALTRSTRKANARFFNSINEVPAHALTMGIRSILDSKEILLLASGKSKAEAIDRLLRNQKIDQDFPASSLHKHSNVIIIADRDALSIADDNERRA